MRRVVLAGLLASGMLATLAGPAAAAGPSPVGASPPQGRLSVGVKVDRFIATAAGTQAQGTATATLTPLGGTPTKISKRVTLAATPSGSCTILTLNLEALELDLLGLDVQLSKVELHVTGNRGGGVLGSLFCSLAHAKVKAARVSAVHRLNAEIRRSGAVRPVAFAVDLRATEAATGSCPVLNLVLGPLNLNLLGLVVDLNQVHLVITAEPTGGVLGGLFCGLANTKVP